MKINERSKINQRLSLCDDGMINDRIEFVIVVNPDLLKRMQKKKKKRKVRTDIKMEILLFRTKKKANVEIKWFI